MSQQGISGRVVLEEGSRIIDALLAAHRGCVVGASSPGLFAAGSYAAFSAILRMMHKEMLAKGVTEETLFDLQTLATNYNLGMVPVSGPGTVMQ